MGEWVDAAGRFIAQVGFPVAVASYLLLRGDKLMRELTGAVHGLHKCLDEVKEILRK